MPERQLYDQRTNAEAVLTYPGVSNADVAEFCEYFRVTFYSAEIVGDAPAGMRPDELFRVATNEFPSRGQNITFKSLVSWREAMIEMGPRVAEHGAYNTTFAGRVTTIAHAKSAEDGPDVVVYKDAKDEIGYVDASKFYGVAFDRETQTYKPNSVFKWRQESVKAPAR